MGSNTENSTAVSAWIGSEKKRKLEALAIKLNTNVSAILSAWIDEGLKKNRVREVDLDKVRTKQRTTEVVSEGFKLRSVE